jgi:ubiquinone biosynthesis protein UbiJ
MPAPQLISAGLELAINKVLSLDESSQVRLQTLAGKSCEVLPIELGFALKFVFTDSTVLVSSPEQEVKTGKLSSDECRIKLSLFAIPELQDTDNITALIKADKLDFEGNLSIAQGFGELFKSLNIDLEEELSKFLGDALAHTTVHNVKQLHQSLLEKAKLSLNTLTDAMLDEKPVAVRAIMIENFNQEVNELKRDTDHLEARIKRLEAQSMRSEC